MAPLASAGQVAAHIAFYLLTIASYELLHRCGTHCGGCSTAEQMFPRES